MVNTIYIIDHAKGQGKKGGRRSRSKKVRQVPQDCKPSTKCGNTGMMPPNMYEFYAKACTNRNCPHCIL